MATGEGDVSAEATKDEPWVMLGPSVFGRSCGGCTLCCTLVPVELVDEQKPAGVKCRHKRYNGCGIYATRPPPCQYWSCLWLFDRTAKELRRPDFSGYVIDPMLDAILVDGQAVQVVQIWCDPARREAHQDPALREWLVGINERFGLLALIRFSSTDGCLVVPPARSCGLGWLEIQQASVSREELNRKLAASNVAPRRMVAEWADYLPPQAG